MTHNPTVIMGTVCVIVPVNRPYLFLQNELLFARLPLTYKYSFFYMYFPSSLPRAGFRNSDVMRQCNSLHVKLHRRISFWGYSVF